MGNDLGLVRRAIKLLGSQGVDTWLAGGWAEELHRMTPPRDHHDVDLLYPADDFAQVDAFLRAGAVDEIEEKRFPHKRAFELDDVMVELIIVRPGLRTDFWGSHRYDWPSDTFADTSGEPRLVSPSALIQFRTHRPPPPESPTP